MKQYIDDGWYCGICDKDTKQEIHESGHERDSSGDWQRCLECGGYYSGFTGKWEPTIVEEVNLFLDDIRNPEDAANYMHPDIAALYRKKKWSIVRNHKEFCNFIIKNGLPSLISFDHDLADIHYKAANDPNWRGWSHYYTLEDREMTGYDCAKWLVEYCMDNNKKLPKFIVHSMNGVGTENITIYLKNANKFL